MPALSWISIQYCPIVVPHGRPDRFPSLNPQQRLAAQSPAHPLLIIAGAGTGKTNTLAHRVAYLVLEGVAPERILLLTFTRRAALEMTRRASRIAAEAHKSVRLPWSGTFHSIANRLIRRLLHWHNEEKYLG